MVQVKSTSQHPEILTACRFYLGLTLDGSKTDIDCHFLECRGFQQTQAPIEICEVTANQWGQAKKGQTVRTKLPGNVKCGNLTLRRGMTSSQELWDWFSSVKEGNWKKQRRLAALSIYNQASQEVARFELAGAWPSSYKITDVNARSTEIEIEELEIAFEEFKRVK
ncbi:MAG: phage tail protein [Methylacidiphilales bacterium]|nr:phage tail protein [Candidatus Methylacidiphilales bacterium]NJR16876.1 phage tail protein [Calothrix sp. CSU_2_0]